MKLQVAININRVVYDNGFTLAECPVTTYLLFLNSQRHLDLQTKRVMRLNELLQRKLLGFHANMFLKYTGKMAQVTESHLVANFRNR